jgi:hypothetical protein
MLDKTKAKLMRAYLEVALTGFEEHFGVAVKIGSIRYEATNARIPLDVSVVSDDGVILSKEAEDFKRYAYEYELKPEWLGMEFQSGGHTFTIEGLKTRAKKYKVIAKRSDGASYKFSHRQVKLYMEKV